MGGLDLLKGVKVITLEQFIAGPYCTSLFADAGAEVTKIERPGVGDPRRNYDPLIGEGATQISGGFASYNRGKKSIELALDTPDGLAKLEKLLSKADIFVSNLRPGALSRMNLAAEELRKRYPRLIVCEITGFGNTTSTEAQSWPAFDSVIQGMSGLSSLIGDSEGPPGLAPMGTTDMLAAIYSAVGVLMALVKRERTGEGCLVDAAMLDIAVAFLERPFTLYEFTKQIPHRGVDRFSPVGVFRAGDGGWLSIVIPTDEMWARCAEAIGRPELTTDPSLDTVLKRAHRMHDLVIPILETWAASLSRHDAASRLRMYGQPVGVVQNISEIRHSEHLQQRNLFVPMLDEVALSEEGTPFALSRLPLLFDGKHALPGTVPKLGEHNSSELHG